MSSLAENLRSWSQRTKLALQAQPPAPILPSSQAPLTDAEYAACQARNAEFLRILSERPKHVGADSAPVLMPDSNWSWHNRNYGYMEAILAGDRRRLDFLRFFTRFTGYSLYYMDYHRDRETPVDLPADLDAVLAPRLAAADRWLQRFVIMTRAHPPEIVVSPPPRFGEVGWNVNGVTVNHDTCVYQERVGLLYQAGIIARLQRHIEEGRRPLIVEIGSGFGGLAFRLMTLFPQADYICIDIPESLLFASLYLGLALPDRRHRVIAGPEKLTQDAVRDGATFVPNHFAFDSLAGIKADLVLNTLSFAELTEAQVAAYAELAATMLGDTGLLFEQNQDNRPLGMIEAKSTLARRFPHRVDLPAIDPVIGLTEGVPSMWGNRPVAEILAS